MDVNWDEELNQILDQQPEPSLMAKILKDELAKIYTELGIWFGD